MKSWNNNSEIVHNVFVLAVALMRAVRSAIYVIPNLSVIQAAAQVTQKESYFNTKINKMRQQPNNLNASLPQNLGPFLERIGKRTIKEKIGQCGELINVLRTLIKLAPIPSMIGMPTKIVTPPPRNKDIWCTVLVCRSSDHMLCFFHYSDNTFADRFSKREFKNIFGDFVVVCDPWLGYVSTRYITPSLLEDYAFTFQRETGRPFDCDPDMSTEEYPPIQLFWQGRNESSSLEKKSYQQADNHLTYEGRLEKYKKIYHPTIQNFLQYLCEENVKAEQDSTYYLRPYMVSVMQPLMGFVEYYK